MNQSLIQIIDDIIKIGMFFYQDIEYPGNYQKALESYLGHELNFDINNPYEILTKYFKYNLIDCFQYYLYKTNDDYNAQVSDVELIYLDNLKLVHLKITRNKNSSLSLTGIDFNLDDIEFNGI